MYLACCHVELPRAAEPSSSSGSGGRVERPPCSPVTQRYRVTASQARARRTRARARQSWGILSEHAQSTGLVPGQEPLLVRLSLKDESQKLNGLNYDGLRMRLYHGCWLCKESETARGCYKTLLSLSPRHLHLVGITCPFLTLFA